MTLDVINKKYINAAILFITAALLLWLVIEYLMVSSNVVNSCQPTGNKTIFDQPLDYKIVECVGNTQIRQEINCPVSEQSTCGNFYVYDSIRELSYIRQIDNYSIQDGKVFIIGDLTSSLVFDDSGQTKISVALPTEDGDDQYYYYDSLEQLPRLLVVDGQTGSIKTYSDIGQVNQTESQIFKQLLNKMEPLTQFQNSSIFIIDG